MANLFAKALITNPRVSTNSLRRPRRFETPLNISLIVQMLEPNPRRRDRDGLRPPGRAPSFLPPRAPQEQCNWTC